MNKPNYITDNDWNLLTTKYQDNMDYLEAKLKENYPVQYLIGHVDFCGFEIKCDERAHIARFDTEFLVDKTVKLASKLGLKSPTILEIGTGTGCISIALAKLIPGADVLAIDINKEAIELAKENAQLNNVNITFVHQDIMKVETISGYDIVISNPPYIDYNDKMDLENYHEPQNSFFAKNKGLEFYEKIISQNDNSFKILAFEIGETQGKALKNISQRYFPGNNCQIEKDLSGKDRYIFITKE